MAVKMRPTDCRTKRPRGALLQLGTDLFISIVENRRDHVQLHERGTSGIPLVGLSNSNPKILESNLGTVSGR